MANFSDLDMSGNGLLDIRDVQESRGIAVQRVSDFHFGFHATQPSNTTRAQIAMSGYQTLSFRTGLAAIPVCTRKFGLRWTLAAREQALHLAAAPHQGDPAWVRPPGAGAGARAGGDAGAPDDAGAGAPLRWTFSWRRRVESQSVFEAISDPRFRGHCRASLR